MRRALTGILVVIMLSACAAPIPTPRPAPTAPETVVFPDENLEAEIR